MKILLPFIILMAIPLAMSAELHNNKGGIVTGVVIDASDSKPVELANIFAIDTAGTVRATAFTHPDGRFNLRLNHIGRYNILISFVGYKTVAQDITFDGNGGIDLGTVMLDKGVELEGAKVRARQLLKKETDRIVYDVSSDPDAYRMPMSEFMSKIPELEKSPLSNGRLVYKDRPISKILINDAENGLINVARQYPMNFIQAAYMSKIELVLPDSPEYGNDEPVLLITLSSPLPFGIAFKADGDADVRGSYNTGADAVLNTSWVGIGVKYGFGYSWPKELENTTERQMLDPESQYMTLSSSNASRSKKLSHDLGLNLFRSFLDDKMNLQVSANTSKDDMTSYSRASSVGMDGAGNEIRSTSGMSDSRTSSPMRLNAGVSLSHKWRAGSQYMIKYTYNDTRSDKNESLVYSGNGTDESSHVLSETGTKTHTALFDITIRDKSRKPLWSLHAGAQYIYRNFFNTTDYQVYDAVTDEFAVDVARCDGLNYIQQVAEANVTFSGNFYRRLFSYSATLRLDDVDNRGMFVSTGTPLDYNDFNILPAATLMFAKKGHKATVRYRTSVRRPSMLQLNPYVDYSDPENLRTGNPLLKGEYSHSLKAEYTREFKIKWLRSAGISYSYSTAANAIEALTKVGEDNIAVTTYGNIGRRSSHDISASIGFRPINAISLNLSGHYRIIDYVSGTMLHNRTKYFDLNARGTFRFLGCFATAILRISPSSSSAQVRDFEMEPLLSASIGRNFRKISLDVSIGASDILHSSKPVYSSISSDNFIQTDMKQRLGRNFSLYISWTFGKFRQIKNVSIEKYDM